MQRVVPSGRKPTLKDTLVGEAHANRQLRGSRRVAPLLVEENRQIGLAERSHAATRPGSVPAARFRAASQAARTARGGKGWERSPTRWACI